MAFDKQEPAPDITVSETPKCSNSQERINATCQTEAGCSTQDNPEAHDAQDAASSAEKKTSASKTKYGNIVFYLKNPMQLDHTSCSPSVVVNTIPWRIMAVPKEQAADGKVEQSFGIYIQCCPKDTYDDRWSCRATTELIVHHSAKDIVRRNEHDYNSNENDWGYANFITMANLHRDKDKLLQDGKLKIEARIWAEPPKMKSYDEFVKDLEQWHGIAQLHINNKRFDKANEANQRATEMNKGRVANIQRKLEAQRKEILTLSVLHGIERIQQAPAEQTKMDRAAIRAAIGNYSCGETCRHNKKGRCIAAAKRGPKPPARSNPPRSPASPSPTTEVRNAHSSRSTLDEDSQPHTPASETPSGSVTEDEDNAQPGPAGAYCAVCKSREKIPVPSDKERPIEEYADEEDYEADSQSEGPIDRHGESPVHVCAHNRGLSSFAKQVSAVGARFHQVLAQLTDAASARHFLPTDADSRDVGSSSLQKKFARQTKGTAQAPARLEDCQRLLSFIYDSVEETSMLVEGLKDVNARQITTHLLTKLRRACIEEKQPPAPPQPEPVPKPEMEENVMDDLRTKLDVTMKQLREKTKENKTLEKQLARAQAECKKHQQAETENSERAKNMKRELDQLKKRHAEEMKATKSEAAIRQEELARSNLLLEKLKRDNETRRAEDETKYNAVAKQLHESQRRQKDWEQKWSQGADKLAEARHSLQHALGRVRQAEVAAIKARFEATIRLYEELLQDALSELAELDQYAKGLTVGSGRPQEWISTLEQSLSDWKVYTEALGEAVTKLKNEAAKLLKGAESGVACIDKYVLTPPTTLPKRPRIFRPAPPNFGAIGEDRPSSRSKDRIEPQTPIRPNPALPPIGTRPLATVAPRSLLDPEEYGEPTIDLSFRVRSPLDDIWAPYQPPLPPPPQDFAWPPAFKSASSQLGNGFGVLPTPGIAPIQRPSSRNAPGGPL
ncbi:unnamed protein product, partial [Mesorhabditis spiculigera]